MDKEKVKEILQEILKENEKLVEIYSQSSKRIKKMMQEL